MKRKQLIKETQAYLHKVNPTLSFVWLKKLKEPELIELHQLLGQLIESDDLIRF